MKLSLIAKPLRSVQVRVMLAGELNARLDRYARYYEHVHGEPVDTRALIPEILRAFLERLPRLALRRSGPIAAR